VTHRHLEISPATTAEELPSAAIVDTLQRGDLDSWLPIAKAIALEPYGTFADRVLHLLDAYPAYGVSPLWRAWIDRCRARVEAPLSSSEPWNLAALRRAMGITQVQLAARMEMSQSDLSKFERRPDVRISTLRAYFAALGGSVRIVFDVGGQRRQVKIGPDGGVPSGRV